VSDIKRRVTQRGPHRDDIEIRVAERPARSHASQGQQKTAALAMKLAELELVKARAGEYPILMLDEVLSELDAERAHRLFAAIGQDAQCIMTTTELDRRADRFDAPCTAFRIERGSLEKED
jgi:DNA replication and repair protein RecF